MKDSTTAYNSVDQDAHEIIREYFETDVPVDDRDYMQLLPSEFRLAHKPERFYRCLASTFGWISASPDNDNMVEAMRLLNEPTRNRADSNATLPSGNGGEEFFTRLTAGTLDANRQDLFLVGERGCGKTFALNSLINFRMKDLWKSGFTFFRADVAKLHELNSELPDDSPLADHLSIQDYMIFHAFFVTLSHARRKVRLDDELDEAIGRFWQSKESNQPKNEFRDFLVAAGKSELIPCWDDVRSCYGKRSHRKEKDEDLYSYLRAIKTKVNSARSHELWDAFCEFMTGERVIDGVTYKAVKIILMVDGLDNIRIDEVQKSQRRPAGISSRKWYWTYIREAWAMCQGRGISHVASRVVYAVRPSTFRDFRAEIRAERHPEEFISWISGDGCFHVAPPDIMPMLRRKMGAARDQPAKSLFYRFLNEGEARETSHDEEITEQHARFIIFVFCFLKSHFKRIPRDLRSTGYGPVRLVLKAAFNDNVRSFSRNLIRSFSALDRYFHLTKHQYANREERVAAFRVLCNGRQTYEASVLGGNTYFVENIDEDVKGRWCPNLFEFFNAAGTRGRWDGLAMLRVLQLLPAANSDEMAYSGSELQDFLSVLGYSKTSVELSMYVAQDFGLISMRDHRMVKLGDKYISVPLWEKTLKGQLVERLPFDDEAVMYLMATGVPMSGVRSTHVYGSILAEERCQQHWLHSDKIPRHFFPALVRTGSHLIRHINSSIKRERQLIEALFDRSDKYSLELVKFWRRKRGIVEINLTATVQQNIEKIAVQMVRNKSDPSTSAAMNAVLRSMIIK